MQIFSHIDAENASDSVNQRLYPRHQRAIPLKVVRYPVHR